MKGLERYPRGRNKRAVIVHSGPEGDRVYIGICGTRKVFNRCEVPVPEGSTVEEIARAAALQEGLPHYLDRRDGTASRQVPV